MNDQSQIEAKIIHLTPPQRFQVAHQLPKERPAEPNPICPTPKNDEFKVVTTTHSKIWAIRILNGTWLLVTLFLKRCTRIDKNLLVVYVALVLLLLQVFLVISRAEAGPQNRRVFNSEHNLNPLIAAGGPSTFWLDPKSTKKIKGFPKVPWAQDSARSLSARAEGCFHLVPGEGECRGLQPKALSAHRPASDSKLFWHLPYRQASCRKARRTYQSWSRAVPRASAPGDVYERSNMSASARQSLEPVNERGNHLPVVIAHITDDVSQTKPAITISTNLIADWQHTRIAPTLMAILNRQCNSSAQAIDRSPVTLAKNPPWQLRLADKCPGTRFEAAGAAAAFWSFSAAGKGLGHAPAMRGSIKSQRFPKPFTLGQIPNAGNTLLAPFINPSTIHFKPN